MPIYEYACPDCRTIFQFWTQKLGETRIPNCPKCDTANMEKIFSTFAISRGSSQKSDSASPEGSSPDFADPAMESKMMEIMSQMEGIDENDPRQMGALLRKLKDSTGMDMGKEMDEAIKMLEKGEDPEKVEEELGPLLGDLPDEEGGYGGGGGGGWSYDDHLYDF